MSDLGSIYGTTNVDGSNTLVIDFSNVDIVGDLNITGTITADTSITLDSTTITTAELGVLDNVTPGTAAASKALVLDTDGNVSGLGTVGCGSIACSSVSQSSPYYLNLGYNVTTGVVNLQRGVAHLAQLTYNNSRYTSTPTSDYSTTGTDGYWWCPSQTGIYLVCCRAQVRASNQDMVVEAALSLVKQNTSNAIGYDFVASTNERNFGTNATSRQDDRDFSKSPSLTTIVRVMSTSEKYRMRVYVSTGDSTATPWILESMSETGMEVTKLA
tara:strand:+ start:1560 stop:2372 length:813 start_codon:yes stop_codon:yes gene_type:complete